MTNKNKPKVTMVIGKVKITNSGFTSTFKMASTNATINGVVKESSRETPGNNLARIITAKAVRTNLMIVFMKRDFIFKVTNNSISL